MESYTRKQVHVHLWNMFDTGFQILIIHTTQGSSHSQSVLFMVSICQDSFGVATALFLIKIKHPVMSMLQDSYTTILVFSSWYSHHNLVQIRLKFFFCGRSAFSLLKCDQTGCIFHRSVMVFLLSFNSVSNNDSVTWNWNSIAQ